MTDRGLKAIYVFKNRMVQDLHEGIERINIKFLKEFLQIPGKRYAFWVAEEGVELTQEEKCLLNSKLVYLHED